MNEQQEAESKQRQKIGEDYARGALLAVSKVVTIVGIIAILGTLLRNGCAWGTDDSDQSGWHRSGLTIHTDARTGVQYFSDGHGGLCVRMSTTNGVPMIKTKYSRYYYE